MVTIDWGNIELVIFDVDGTLYNQNRLRKIMFFKLFFHYLIRPWKYRDLIILYHFRKERERHAGYVGTDLENEQYIWCAQQTNESIQKIKDVVSKWIFTFPNPYLKDALYSGADQFIEELKAKGIKTATYSDYNSKDKLNAMNIVVDMEVCSTDKSVNCFKPESKGLVFLMLALGVTQKERCVFIGDRIELDGVCAQEAGVPFLLINEKDTNNNFYSKLSRTLIASRC
jgi:putative hydrolase of the HAD superfamily